MTLDIRLEDLRDTIKRLEKVVEAVRIMEQKITPTDGVSRFVVARSMHRTNGQ